MGSHFTNVSGAMAWSGSPAGGSLMSAIARHSHYGWIWLWLAGLARSCATLMSSLTAPNMRHYDDSSRRRYQIFVSPAPVCCRCWTLFRWTDCRDTPSTKSPCGRRLIVTLFWRWRTATFESHVKTSLNLCCMLTTMRRTSPTARRPATTH